MTVDFQLEEATIEDMSRAMNEGLLTSVELTSLYLSRIYYYDQNGLHLNSIPLLNDQVLQEAQRMDDLRAEGVILGPLHGIPFTVKDSYMVKGMTVSNGSPAFAHLTADRDSFMVEVIRHAGGILLGKTNMPPMAAGGMQRGLYGRAESPYNGDYLPAAWFSGSSNGSGTSTAANFAAFGMAEETVSSGRSPASNNGLVAYTPSWGLLSIRGNWPLFPMRDVVVPHTRTVSDLLTVLDVIMNEDTETQCDFWRNQNVVSMPDVNSYRPDDFAELKVKDSLRGKRIGVPKMYIGKDPRKNNPITIRPSILALWERTRDDLIRCGASVVEVDFPLMERYEEDPIFLLSFKESGWLREEWMIQEWDYLTPYALESFLRYVNDPNYPSWQSIDPDTVFPNPIGSVDERNQHNNARYRENIEVIKRGCQPLESLPGYRAALLGVERMRQEGFESWLAEQGLDMLVFPANCDVGQANADINDEAYADAWKNGSFFSNTNHMLRHLGIPSVSVCMGMMEDIQMPVNLTFIGPSYSDLSLLSYAYSYEQATGYRVAGTRTPPLSREIVTYRSDYTVPSKRKNEESVLNVTAEVSGVTLVIRGKSNPEYQVYVSVNGVPINVVQEGGLWQGSIALAQLYRCSHRMPQLFNVISLIKGPMGNTRADYLRINLAA